MRSVEVIASRFTSNKVPRRQESPSKEEFKSKSQSPKQPALSHPTLSRLRTRWFPAVQSSLSPSVTLTISTSEMLSRLSTWTSTPTGIAGPRKKNNKTQKLRKYKPDEIKFWHLRK